jgi:hypothetical protein
MKKTVLAGVLFALVVFAVFGQSVSDFDYTTRNGGIYITGYKGNVKAVVIPEKINGLPVVGIEDGDWDRYTADYIGVFSGKQLTSVTIPNSVTTIGDYAFLSNQLTSVTIGANVQIAGDSFDGSLKQVYDSAGKKAGRYTKSGDSWTYAGSR